MKTQPEAGFLLPAYVCIGLKPLANFREDAMPALSSVAYSFDCVT